MNIRNGLSRFLMLITAFVVGWGIYIIGVFSMPYSGFFGVLFQVIFGVVVSGVTVLISYAVGFVLNKYLFKNAHIDNGVRFFILLLSFLILVFGNKVGLTQQYTNLELGETFQSLNANVVIICYVVIIFFIANWPVQKSSKRL